MTWWRDDIMSSCHHVKKSENWQTLLNFTSIKQWFSTRSPPGIFYDFCTTANAVLPCENRHFLSHRPHNFMVKECKRSEVRSFYPFKIDHFINIAPQDFSFTRVLAPIGSRQRRILCVDKIKSRDRFSTQKTFGPLESALEVCFKSEKWHSLHLDAFSPL